MNWLFFMAVILTPVSWVSAESLNGYHFKIKVLSLEKSWAKVNCAKGDTLIPREYLPKNGKLGEQEVVFTPDQFAVYRRNCQWIKK